MCAFWPGGNPIKAAFACALSLALAGCTTGMFDDDRVIQLTPKPVEAPDFVRQSRPATPDYISVSPPSVEKKVPLKSKEELAAAEATLAAKVAGNRAAATRARPPSNLDGKIEPGYRPPKPQPVPETNWNGLKAPPSQKSLRKSVTTEQ